MRIRLGVRARGVAFASAVLTFIACGFGVDLDGLFDGPAADTSVPKVQVAQIGVGSSFACARRIDGTVMCWGYGEDGRLGDGLQTSSSKPVLVRDVNNAIDLSVGAYHACAVRKDSSVVCWGVNSDGQLGDGTNATAFTPSAVVAFSEATQVAAGRNFTCALKKDGSVHCWGQNGNGQLGDGKTSSRSKAEPVVGLADATQIAAAAHTACALVKSGDVYCWGLNNEGQVADPKAPKDNVRTPVKLEALSGVVSLGRGGTAYHLCAVLGTGEARCWGNADKGEIGHSKGENFVTKPTAVVGLTDATAVAMGNSFTCALGRGGGVSCWGINSWRQLGLGDTKSVDNTSTPVQVDALSGIEQIATGEDFACALHAGGERISCWGSNRYGTLGRNSRLLSSTPVKVDGVTATTIGLGREHGCVTTPEGAIACWGMNNWSQQAASFSATGKPVPVEGIGGAASVGAGDLHTCAIIGQSTKCWGYNWQGGLGNNRWAPAESTPQTFAAGPATDVSGGYHFTCALLATTEVACVGRNDEGRTGRPGGNSVTPDLIRVPGPPEQTEPDAGADAASPGDGGPDDGGPGDGGDGVDGGDGNDGGSSGGGGPSTSTTVPFSDVSRLSVGRFHSCAIHGGGKVSCWGSPYDGMLGVSGGARSTPSQVPLPLPAIDVAAAKGTHTCVVLQDGSVRCWGNNGSGQVSGTEGSGTQQRTPDLGGKQAKAITAGDAHTCVLYTDGTIGCWGRGKKGQLGNGTLTNAAQPVAVKDIMGAKAIAANADRTCAIGGDGSAWCWGDNAQGELGDGVVILTGVPGPVFGY